MKIKHTLNEIILPLKLLIPQPIINKIPGLTTNEEIRINKVLKFVTNDSICLDIGCGVNKLIQMHRLRGGSGLGVDVHPWEGVDIVVEDSSLLPFDNATFDCITFVACLNHIPNRKKTLKEAHRALKEDGIVIITFLGPTVSMIWHKICFWDKDQNLRGMKEGEVYGFNDIQVCSLFEQADFKVVKKKTFSLGMNKLYIFSKA